MRRAFLGPLLIMGTGLLVPFAPAGSARADVAQGSAPNDLDRLLGRFENEERALRAELVEVAPKLDVTRRRMVARGRSYYRMVHAGLLPAGAG